MRSLAHTVLSHLVIPFGVWFSFNFGNTLFNLLFIFGSDSHSRCHSSCSKLLEQGKDLATEAQTTRDTQSLPANQLGNLPTENTVTPVTPSAKHPSLTVEVNIETEISVWNCHARLH